MPIEILMPALSPTMTEGNLAKWCKQEGDTVSAGDLLAEIETDKATMEVEAVDEGVLGKILVSGGTKQVKVNSVIALLLEEGEDKKALEDYTPSQPEATEEEKDAGEDKAASGRDKDKVPAGGAPATGAALLSYVPTQAPEAPPAPKGERLAISPVAKRMAEAGGINLQAVVGTGPKGRIVKADVEAALQRGGTSGSVRRQGVEFVRAENTTMRQTIAKRLLESKQQVPHFYLTVDCVLDALLDIRTQLNTEGVKRGIEGNPAYKLSVNDFIIKASALALRDVPEANATWYDDAIVLYNNIDIAVAVAMEGGLITPVVKNADQKSLPHISSEMKDLAKRARDGKLQPEEYQGGGFSISNLGMYGIKNFSAIINPPQSCILAVGAGEQRPIVTAGELAIATVMSCTLSVDHRSVDGAVGANFLAVFKHYIEQPALMLV